VKLWSTILYIHCILLACTVPAATVLAQEQPVSAGIDNDRVQILVGGELFTSYRFARSQKYPYFWPVNGPVTGRSITTESSQPYPHHHSLFFGCDRVNGGN